MLVLSRRESQSIMIGKDIVITVISIRGDQVRIGIEAPRSVTVHRQEVALAIEAANREAAAAIDFDPTTLPGGLPKGLPGVPSAPKPLVTNRSAPNPPVTNPSAPNPSAPNPSAQTPPVPVPRGAVRSASAPPVRPSGPAPAPLAGDGNGGGPAPPDPD